MKPGEILQGHCASEADQFKSIDPKLKPELIFTPKFYKYTLELISINSKDAFKANAVGTQSDYVCVDYRWLYLPFVLLLASLVNLF